jgi:hypothetical protein
MARSDKAQVALAYPTFALGAHLRALWADNWKGAAMVTLGGAGLVAAAMLVGWLMERLAG